MKRYRGRRYSSKKIGLGGRKRRRTEKLFLFIIIAIAAAVTLTVLAVTGVFTPAPTPQAEEIKPDEVITETEDIKEEIAEEEIVIEDMQEAVAKPDIEAYENAQALILGMEGEEVKNLQQRLCELDYLENDDVTGSFGKKTRIAVINFQKKHGLQYDGIAGPETQAYIYFEDATPYVFEFGDGAPTTYMTFPELIGDDGITEAPESYPEKGTYRLVADIERQTLIAYEKDSAGTYTIPVRYMLCSIGDKTETGTLETGDHKVRFGTFDSDGLSRQYWTQIDSETYITSVLYSEKNASTYIEDSYSGLGSSFEGKGIRLTVPDARWVFYHIAGGSEIVIRMGADDDVATTEIRNSLKLAQLPAERITLEPGNIPDTDNWSIDGIY